MEGSVDAAPLVPGQVLENKYRVSRALGSGAMGIVYEAYHLRLEKAVAVKVLRPELASVADLRDRFEAEARAAAALGHPNIVTVTDLGQTPSGALYFVMDRLRGETLGERLEREGKLDVASATRITLEVLSGLEAAHELMLVHRDLKPDNIFLARPPGGRELAKILDFGVAKALASLARRSNGTRVGTTVGTPLYMAPEQAMGDPDIDARADLYSMGVILYQVLGGRPPFEGPDATSVMAAKMLESPPALSALCPAAPFALIRLVEAAMSRDRNQRPATAADFMARLQEATANAAATATPVPYDSAGLHGAFDAPVLVDLSGQELTPAPPAAAPTLIDEALFTADDQLPSDSRATVREAGILPIEERMAAPAPLPPPRPRRALWLLALPVLALGLVVAPRLFGQHEIDGANDIRSAAARPMALVHFDLGGAESQLFLDGSPLASNPITLGSGELHTITAVAGGRVVGIEKFLVDQPQKTVRVRVERR
jgi:serine/threonine protein kinase